jgi:hypothetical protein
VLRAVLGAADDAELGFRPPRRSGGPHVPAAVAVAGGDGDGDAWERLVGVVARPSRVDHAAVERLAAVLAQHRRLEDVVGARQVLPSVLAEVELIDRLAAAAAGPVRTALVRLAGEYRQFRRDHGRYASNLALAAALDGQVDRATAAGREALTPAVQTSSVHTLTDLRRMRRALQRWHRDPAVVEFDAAVRDAGRAGRAPSAHPARSSGVRPAPS